MRSNEITSIIEDLEYRVARIKFIEKSFPKAKINSAGQISCKTVNSKYTALEFFKNNWGLYVFPYCELEFFYNGNKELIRINSAPRKNRLIYLTWRTTLDRKRIMRFSRLSFNLKNNQFRSDMLSKCQAQIVDFISEHPGFHIEDKHLDPRLKKMISFI